MVKVAISMNLLPLVILFNSLVSGESDAGGGGLEIPPEVPPPQRRKLPGRSWESWMSPEGTLWYPGQVDYRKRGPQSENGAGADPRKSGAHDTSTRRYFSLEEGPQYLSEHRVANSAQSQHGEGGVEAGIGGRGTEQGWYPYEGQYGPKEESQLPGESNGQYPIDTGDQYGSYGQYEGNVPYGQYFLNGQRVPDVVDPLVPKPNGDYVPDHMRGHYIPGQAGQGGQYIPGENGQLIPGQDGHYVHGNGDRNGLGPDYGPLPDPNGGQNGQYLPENDPRGYYIDGHDDYYPDGEYPYYYETGDYGPIGAEGGEHGVYIPPAHQIDPNMPHENGQQPMSEIDGQIPAGQDEVEGQDGAAGHSVHMPNPGSNHMIFAGRDFLPVPTAQNNHSSGHRDVPDKWTRHEPEDRRVIPNSVDREEIPNLIHREEVPELVHGGGARIDSSRPAQNHSSNEGWEVRREHEIHSGRQVDIDRRITETTTTARPTERRPDTTTEQHTTTEAATTTTTAATTIRSTTTAPPTTTTIPSTTTTSTPAPTTQAITTSPTTTTRRTVETAPPYPYNPRNGRPTHYPTREHQRGRGTNSHTDARPGMRPDFDEAFYPRLPIQRPTIASVEIDLSKLMPEEAMHKPDDSGSSIDTFHHRQHIPSAVEQRSTLSPNGAAEDERRRRPHSEGSETHGIVTPNRRDPHNSRYQQPDPRREQLPSGRQHSSQTGSTGSGVVSYGRLPTRHDIIHQRPLPTRHEEEDQSSEHRSGQHTGGNGHLPSRWPERSRTDQWSGRGHQTIPDRRRNGSYQPIGENGSFAAGRDRTHSQVHPEVDSRHSPPTNTDTGRQTYDSSIDGTDESDYSGEGLPGISQRGACPSVSQCRCCRWSTQQTRKSMECLQPKFKTVEVQVCTQEYNGVCVRTRKRKTLKPDGTEVRMCSKVQLKRSCFVCCPTFYPRGHNQTCNGVLDGIDKKGLRISVEADIGGFYQPPRLSKSTAQSQHTMHQTVRDQSSQQRMPMSQRNGHAAQRAPSSIMGDTEKGMMADQTGNPQRMCLVQTMGANGQTTTERRACSSVGEVTTPAEGENTTAPCCLSREQLQSMFLRYCCGTKRYNGRQYSQRMCCGTKERPTKQNGGRVEPLARSPRTDMRQTQFTNGRNTEGGRTIAESEPLRLGMDSPPDMDSQSHINMETQMKERSRAENPETMLPVESEPQSLDVHPETQESVNPETHESVNPETQESVDSVRPRKCCPPGTRLRSRNMEESIERQESPDTSRHSNGRRSGYVMWSRVYSCCANGNYLRKVACCLQRSGVSKLCCRKVSSLRS